MGGYASDGGAWTLELPTRAAEILPISADEFLAFLGGLFRPVLRAPTRLGDVEVGEEMVGQRVLPGGSTHLRVRIERLEHVAEGDAEGDGGHELVLDERAEEDARDAQLLLRVFVEEAVLVEQVVDHAREDLLLAQLPPKHHLLLVNLDEAVQEYAKHHEDILSKFVSIIDELVASSSASIAETTWDGGLAGGETNCACVVFARRARLGGAARRNGESHDDRRAARRSRSALQLRRRHLRHLLTPP